LKPPHHVLFSRHLTLFRSPAGAADSAKAPEGAAAAIPRKRSFFGALFGGQQDAAADTATAASAAATVDVSYLVPVLDEPYDWRQVCARLGCAAQPTAAAAVAGVMHQLLSDPVFVAAVPRHATVDLLLGLREVRPHLTHAPPSP
jgi:hypothetical protein